MISVKALVGFPRAFFYPMSLAVFFEKLGEDRFGLLRMSDFCRILAMSKGRQCQPLGMFDGHVREHSDFQPDNFLLCSLDDENVLFPCEVTRRASLGVSVS